MHVPEYYQAMVLSNNLRTFWPATCIPSSLIFGASGAFSATYASANSGGRSKRAQSPPPYATQLGKKLRTSTYT